MTHPPERYVTILEAFLKEGERPARLYRTWMGDQENMPKSGEGTTILQNRSHSFRSFILREN